MYGHTRCGVHLRLGAMAQLVAHLTGSEGVRGSSPLSSTEAFWTRDAELSRFRYLDRTARRLIWDVDSVAPYPWLIYLIGSTIEKAHSPVRLYISARFCRV